MSNREDGNGRIKSGIMLLGKIVAIITFAIAVIQFNYFIKEQVTGTRKEQLNQFMDCIYNYRTEVDMLHQIDTYGLPNAKKTYSEKLEDLRIIYSARQYSNQLKLYADTTNPNYKDFQELQNKENKYYEALKSYTIYEEYEKDSKKREEHQKKRLAVQEKNKVEPEEFGKTIEKYYKHEQEYIGNIGIIESWKILIFNKGE